MKSKLSNFIWGVVLIILSELLFARSLGVINFKIFSESIWIWFCVFSSTAFFLSYFLNGIHRWVWLFPA